jgi:hypothetical protein
MMILKPMADRYYEYCRKNNLMPTEEGYKIWFEALDILLSKTENDIIHGTSTMEPKGLFGVVVIK